MRPFILLSLITILACVGFGCSKFAAYERNLTFINDDTLREEISVRELHVEEAQKRLNRIQQTGDEEAIEQAEGVLEDAQEQLEIAEEELISRSPTSRRHPEKYVRIKN